MGDTAIYASDDILAEMTEALSSGKTPVRSESDS